MLLPTGQTSLSVSPPLNDCPCQLCFFFWGLYEHICRGMLLLHSSMCQQHSHCEKMHTPRDMWKKKWKKHTHTRANEMLHFMLHESENGIWKEVDSASSQRTRSSPSIPPQEKKKSTAMQLPAQSSKRQWLSQAVTANNKLINDTVITWLIQMKRISNRIQWEHKSQVLLLTASDMC